MNKRMTKYGQKALWHLAKIIAARDSNTSCPFLGYQPKLPKAVENLKKQK